MRGRHPVLAGAASDCGFSPLAFLGVACMARQGVLLPLCGHLSSSRGQRPTCTLPIAGAANSALFPGAVSSRPGTVASGGEKSLGDLTEWTVAGSPGPPHQPPRADVHSTGTGGIFREPALCSEVSTGQVGRMGLRAPRPVTRRRGGDSGPIGLKLVLLTTRWAAPRPPEGLEVQLPAPHLLSILSALMAICTCPSIWPLPPARCSPGRWSHSTERCR